MKDLNLVVVAVVVVVVVVIIMKALYPLLSNLWDLDPKLCRENELNLYNESHLQVNRIQCKGFDYVRIATTKRLTYMQIS